MRGCIGRPASLSLNIETMESEKTMTFLLHKLHFTFKIASLCRASNLLRRIFIISKSHLNKRILFNSFTYLSVCVCVCVCVCMCVCVCVFVCLTSLAPTLPHNWRCGTGSWSCEIRILPQTGDGNLYRGNSRRFNVYYLLRQDWSPSASRDSPGIIKDKLVSLWNSIYPT